MKIARFIMGCVVPILAAVLGVLIAMMVINGEWIMFNTQNRNALVSVLIYPVLIELSVYVVWFMIKTKGISRNSDKLAKNSLLFGIPSIASSCLLLFGMGALYSLWEEGSLFLVISAILYGSAGMIQYKFCRPY